MRALFLPGGRQVQIRDAEDPVPGVGQVLISMRAAGLCGSDVHMHYRPTPEQRHGKVFGLQTDPDVVPGHEPAGVVAALGPGEHDLAVGERVAVHHMGGCGHCVQCRRGWDINCPNKWGVYGLDKPGAMADLMVARDSDCVRIPEQVSFAEACYYACGAGTGYLALHRAGLRTGDSVAVVGLGPVGVAAAYFAARGGAVVVGMDTVDERRTFAIERGVEHTANPVTGDALGEVMDVTGGGADVVIETSGSAAGRSLALDAAGVDGRVVLVGFADTETTLDVQRQIIQKQVDVRGAWMFPITTLQSMLDSVAREGATIEPLIPSRYPLEEGERAWREFDGGSLGKTVITWEDE